MPRLLLVHQDVTLRSFALRTDTILIGRHSDNDIRLDDASVSARHARLSRVPSPYLEGHYDVFIEDLGSTNGTEVNARRVSQTRLAHGDEIRIGHHRFRYEADPDFGADSTAIYLPGTERG